MQTLEPTRMKHFVALTMIAFLIPAAAVAKDNPCKEDKAKFCKDVKSSGGKVGSCLRQHKDEVSDACKARLSKPKEAASADKAADKAAKKAKKEAKPDKKEAAPAAAPDAGSSTGPGEAE
jgi:Cysteine rich repeat